ncbi:aldehyde dehydrogenase family protein [Shouchella shacheensis]|uniref:aldehyde dehydrogenase family protein n=1 Tax=Shouchella shacheensis TaxID=1649580 RepID=UPI0007400DEB|nr:aldehyde dehydrogenase family protein [Shouchella shacheensis]
MKTAYPYINGKWIQEERESTDIFNPYSKEVIGKQYAATTSDVEEALNGVYEARKRVKSMPAYERARILQRAAFLLEERKHEFAQLISKELGKALKNTKDEVARSVETLELSAEEAKRLHGETIPGDASERGVRTLAHTYRVPAGVIAAITPFNAPLNLVCHKVGPAFAAGNTVILKPAPQTTLIATAFLELLLEAGYPEHGISMVLGGVETGRQIVADERVNVISFTGGVVAARDITKQAGMKKVLLELGGNSSTIVHEDADIADAAKQCAKTGFSNSGQSCISVQRIYVHASIVDAFTTQLKKEVEQLKAGNPLSESTDVGTLVDEEAAARIKDWIDSAVSAGGELVTGGIQEGVCVKPTVLRNPPKTENVVCQEVFGPIVSVLSYQSIDEAIAETNRSDFGLQAGVFTNQFDLIYKVAEEVEVGGVVMNGTSNFRLDHWPYGGIKNSGIGREGPRFAIEEMTETKMIVLKLPK